MTPRPRPEILEIDPYVGGASTLPGINRVVKLSSNEGAFGAAARRPGGLPADADELHRYPDGAATELRRAIGARFGLDPARIVCGAGSDDLIYQLCLSYGGPGTEIVMSAHGFAMYEIAGATPAAAWSSAGAQPDRRRGRHAGRGVAGDAAVFLANPNNPTGSMLPAAEVTRLRAGLPPRCCWCWTPPMPNTWTGRTTIPASRWSTPATTR